ncbi:hypothetical protein [Sporosarcina sp. ITBMC105]
MPLIPQEALPHFENQIYLPMLLTILTRDRASFERGPFKLNAPYLRLVDAALDAIHLDLKESSDYLRNRKYRIERTKDEPNFTTYTYYYDGYTDDRRFLNVRLRNRSEELLELYLMK